MASVQPDILDGRGQTNPPSMEQREPLLQTKLFVPPPRPDRVARPHLFEQINNGLNKALILVSAPAGYGKTTLVSSWLEETGIPSTWLSLDDDDNDPRHFLQYFITALQQVVPTVQPDVLGVLPDTQPASIRFFMNVLINAIAGQSVPFAFVLDDFHTIQAQSVLEMMTHLLDHIPPQMHLVLLTRTDPPVPLARLRARNQLIEIRADQLRFTQAEIALFLNEGLELKLSSHDIMALEARTEGWIAGLQLASIALQDSNDAHGFISAFTGSHNYIMDYLAEEVLRLQPEAVRSFLLQSSILNRMCGPLCDEVVGAGLGDGQTMLETLQQMNMFIVPLDGDRRWYRYHRLFADVLSNHLEQHCPDRLADLHCRASRWHEQNGLIAEAIQHARMAGDQERAAQLVDQHGCSLLMRGEVVNLLKWIEAIEPRFQALPWIAVQKVWALCLTGQLDRVETPFLAAEQLISSLEPTDDVRTMLGALYAARACHANLCRETRLAADFARQALDQIPASNDFSCSLRSVATSILGDASRMEGNLAEARQAYTEAVLISQAAGNIHMLIITSSNLADILMEQGQLQQAARMYSEILQKTNLPDGQISPLVERVYASLAQVLYEWNHLESAEEHILQCIELSKRWESIEYQAVGYAMLARLNQARGNFEKAREAMRIVEQLIKGYPISVGRSIWLKAALARLWICRGDLERASDLVQKSGVPIDGLSHAGEISYHQEPLYLTLLHLHLARGDTDSASTLAELLLQKLDATNQVGRVIEALILQTLALQGRRDLEHALAVLEQAFLLAQPEGYVRIFLDEGEPMAKLLYQARSHRIGGEYATELLSAMSKAPDNTLPPAEFLIEPLTSRELELLKLIEAGCSNQEIADQLVISIPTVKRHISNIYTKLGVGSRTQAVARAKEFNLLDTV